MKKALFVLLISVCLLYGCSGQMKWHTATLLYFDTVCEITIFCNPKIQNSALKEVEGTFQEIEKLFSPASAELDSPLVISLFRRAQEIYNASGGGFDITVAPLSHTWGFENKDYRLPSPGEINQALGLVGMNRVTVTDEGIILAPGMRLDWGGIAKGYGIDLASRALIERGILRGFVNAGGDLYCWGKNPEGRDWRVGIIHPRKQGIIKVLALSETAAATTGDYQRFFLEDGVRYHHVFDPRSGYPAAGKQSVTVVGPEALLCDALSTALFVQGAPDRILELYPDYGAIIVDFEGKISYHGKTNLVVSK